MFRGNVSREGPRYWNDAINNSLLLYPCAATYLVFDNLVSRAKLNSAEVAPTRSRVTLPAAVT